MNNITRKYFSHIEVAIYRNSRIGVQQKVVKNLCRKSQKDLEMYSVFSGEYKYKIAEEISLIKV